MINEAQLYPIAAQLAAAVISKQDGRPSSGDAVDIFYRCLETLQERNERGQGHPERSPD